MLSSISLFDFESAPEEKTFDPIVQANWSHFLYTHRPVTIILRIDRRALADQLITSDEAERRTDGGVIISPVEVCYPHPIALEALQGCVVTYRYGRRKHRVLDSLPPSLTDLETINQQFRTSILSGEEEHKDCEFGKFYLVTRLEYISENEMVILELSDDPVAQPGIRMTYEGVTELTITEQLPKRPGYVEIIDGVDERPITSRVRYSMGAGVTNSSEEREYEITTDIRKFAFLAQSLEIT